MRGIAVSVESIRRPLIYAVVEHVPHDLIFLNRIRYVKKKLHMYF